MQAEAVAQDGKHLTQMEPVGLVSEELVLIQVMAELAQRQLVQEAEAESLVR